jgi:hypothetical protein
MRAWPSTTTPRAGDRRGGVTDHDPSVKPGCGDLAAARSTMFGERSFGVAAETAALRGGAFDGDDHEVAGRVAAGDPVEVRARVVEPAVAVLRRPRTVAIVASMSPTHCKILGAVIIMIIH